MKKHALAFVGGALLATSGISLWFFGITPLAAWLGLFGIIFISVDLY